MSKITEQESLHNNLDKLSTLEVLRGINKEDKKVALAVEKEIQSIVKLTDAIVDKMKLGGRLFYVGAGTSGRLGVVDASECPPTFGVANDVVIGLIAGGDKAIRNAVENAEDDEKQGWEDLQAYNLNQNDVVIGIAASGSTPYVIGALKKCNEQGIVTGGITCNPNSLLDQVAQFPVVPVVGPEFVTGSTRMKSGTAQKLVLNMISTTVMIKLGKVVGNRMVDMQLSNEKLVGRGTKMIQEQLGINYNEAEQLLLKHGSVRKAVESY